MGSWPLPLYAGGIWKRRFHSGHTSNVFRVLHTTPEEYYNATITGHFGFCWKKTRAGKSRGYCDVIVIQKLQFQDFLRPHASEKPPFWNSSRLKSVFEKLRFRDGLVWTVGLTVEIKLRFQILRRQYCACGGCLRSCFIEINRLNCIQLGLIQLTFLNRTLFQPFSVETRWFVEIVLSEIPSRGILITHLLFQPFQTVLRPVKKLTNQTNRKWLSPIEHDKSNQLNQAERLIKIEHSLSFWVAFSFARLK